MTDWKSFGFLLVVVVLSAVAAVGAVPPVEASVDQPALALGEDTEQSDDGVFDVEITGTNSPVQASRTLRVDFKVTNTGDSEDTQRVQLLLDGEPVDDTFKEFTLASGESETFQFTDSIVATGEYEVGVRSDDDIDSTDITVEPRFLLTILTYSERVEIGEPFELKTTVLNPDDADATQDIELRLDGELVQTKTVTVRSDTEEAVEFEYDTSGLEPGRYNVTVSSNAESLSVNADLFEPETVYWQVDFGEGADPPAPPSYWPNDLMAVLGNSDDGVTQNPSVRRQLDDSQLGAVNIIDNEFKFDDEGNSTEVTVKFELEDGADARDLHLATYRLPGPFDEDEIGQQEQFDVANGSFEGGDTGELTVSLP